MKTLDEVIKALDACQRGACINCPYYNSDADICDEPVQSDALHYLKEYRSDQIQWEADRKLWVDKQKQVDEARQKYIDKLKELEIGTLNDPLTWEELREMEGKPVYWTHDLVGEWLTIYGVPKNDDNVIYATTCSGVECWIYKKDMDRYKYYRKEKQ